MFNAWALRYCVGIAMRLLLLLLFLLFLSDLQVLCGRRKPSLVAKILYSATMYPRLFIANPDWNVENVNANLMVQA